MDQFEISTILPVSPDVLFRAWLDSAVHGAFTGSPAEIADGVGGAFSAWDGYISGRTLELDPPRRILQAWRTTEFPPGAADSRLELRFEPSGAGTRLTLHHSRIPEGQGSMYAEGWHEHYFAPMRRYFSHSPR